MNVNLIFPQMVENLFDEAVANNISNSGTF